MEVVANRDHRQGCLSLHLTAEDGTIGRSEAALPKSLEPLLATLNDVKTRELSRLDARSPAKSAYQLLSLAGCTPSTTFAAAVALVETACWDLAARCLGVPLHRLFGGAIRDRIPACAAGWEPSSSGSEIFSEAASRVARRGYKIIRLDPFEPGKVDLTRSETGRAIRVCESVRAAVGPDVSLWIDFGGRFAPAEAIRLSKALERVEPSGIFEPLSPTDRLALPDVARRSSLPLAIGENLPHWSSARDLLIHRHVSLIVSDPSLACGFAATRTLAALAETNGIGIALRSHSGPIALAGAIHLGATLPNLTFIEHRVSLSETPEPGVPDLIDGTWFPSEGSGLSVT